MEVVDGRLVAVYWWTPEDVRRRLMDPESAVLTVRAWRDGKLIDDPTGVGAELRREARDWTWDRIEHEADSWVADKLVVWAEYLPKLTGALEAGRLLDAAALRAQLMVQLAELFAVRRRLVEESENGLWETIAEAGDAEWRSAVERALAPDDEADGAFAAITVFRLVADDVEQMLDDRQRSVVDYALSVSRNPG